MIRTQYRLGSTEEKSGASDSSEFLQKRIVLNLTLDMVAGSQKRKCALKYVI